MFYKEIIKNFKKYYDTTKLSVNFLGNEGIKRLKTVSVCFF